MQIPDKIFVRPSDSSDCPSECGIGNLITARTKRNDGDVEYINLKGIWHSPKEEPKPSPTDIYGSVKESETILLLVVTKHDGMKIMYSTHEELNDDEDEGYWVFHEIGGEEKDYNPIFDEIETWSYLSDHLPSNS